MSNDILRARDVEDLINSYGFLSPNIKKVLQNIVYHEIDSLTSETSKEEVLHNIYNVYTIAGKFCNEDLFKNGRIIFKDDNELVFDAIVGPHITYTEISLFDGCTIAKGDGSSYILLNNGKKPETITKLCKSFNFDKLVSDAITPPAITIVLNIGYYSYVLEEILLSIR